MANNKESVLDLDLIITKLKGSERLSDKNVFVLTELQI